MGKHLVLGAGAIGQATARELAGLGEEVIVGSRSGRDPGIVGVRAIAIDATDAADVTRAAQGCTSLINAMNPSKYHTWKRDWPPIAEALLAASERTAAGLVTVSNLYLYGRVDAPMTESTAVAPDGRKGRVRAQMWADALAAHAAGRIRATELRASDYFGPGAGAGMSLLNQFVIRPASAGRTVRLLVGGPDVPHTWTYVEDIGRLGAVLATDDRSWGQAWHVPSPEPRTQREVATDAARLTGSPEPAVTTVPGFIKKMLRVSPTIRELDETAHQFERPFVLDASKTESTFGFAATPWPDALARTIGPVRPSLQLTG